MGEIRAVFFSANVDTRFFLRLAAECVFGAGSRR